MGAPDMVTLTDIVGLSRQTGNDRRLVEFVLELRDSDLLVGFRDLFHFLEKPFGGLFAGRRLQVAVEKTESKSILGLRGCSSQNTHSVKVLSQLLGPFNFNFLIKRFASFLCRISVG
jgi:hypothetical protein